MGIFSRLRPEVRGIPGEVGFEDPLMRAILGGEKITKEIALQVPTVSGGVDLIANIIAGTPVKLYREKDGKAEEVRDDPRVKLLNDETGDTLNANEFWRAMVRDYYLGKGGYAYICKRRGEYKSLHYIDEAQISICKNEDPIFKDFDILVQGHSYKPFDFFKILRGTKDGAQGVPITEESSKLIEAAYQGLCFELNLVKKGGNKKGFLRTEKRVDRETLEEIRRAFTALYSNNSDNVMVLNNGLQFQESSNTSVEMQLNENKNTNAREFAKIFHIAPEVIEGGAQADTASLARLAAIPLMSVIQCALNRDLLREKEKGRYYWAFDTKELLKGDMKSRFEAYKTALDANFMQIDEVRFAEDMEPLGLTWIKLGLNDVLYDPKTKTIYTPNTDKTGRMGEMPGGIPEGAASPEKATEDTQETDAEAAPEDRAHWIKGAKGYFAGSVSDAGAGSGGKNLTNGEKDGNLQSSSKPEWGKKEAGEPFDYWELSEDKTGFPRRWKPTGFSHETTRRQHFEDHGASAGTENAADYEAKAMEFFVSPRGKHGDAFVGKSGDVYRYDYDSGFYGVATKTGTIKTFWNLNSDRGSEKAAKYWKEQLSNGT